MSVFYTNDDTVVIKAMYHKKSMDITKMEKNMRSILLSSCILLIASSAALNAGDWFVAPKYSSSFTAITKRDTTATIAGVQKITVEDGANADRDLDSYGIMVGKRYENWRGYLNYDRFSYDKDSAIFADKNVRGWVMTANADYIQPIYGPLSLFAGAALTVAGSKPDGMDSNPAPGYGGQVGAIVELYKKDNYRLFAEVGYRYIRTNIKATESNNPEQMRAVSSVVAPMPVTSLDVETTTTALKNSYFALVLTF